jgi:hypothetical protein
MTCTPRDFSCGVRPGSAAAVPVATPAVACPGMSATIGAHTLTQTAAGCLSVARTNFTIPDGVYQNATVTMTGGYITAIASGTNVLQAVTPLCTAASTDGGTATGATVALSTDPCNLSAFAGGLLSTMVYAEGTRGVNVSGCGTAADPIVIQGPILPTVPVVTGATAASCGIDIQGGLVKTWTAPLMALTTAVDSGITLTTNAATCSVDVKLTPVTTSATTTTRYAEPVGVAFAPDTSSSTTTNGTLSVWGHPATSYVLQWQSDTMLASTTHHGSGTTFSIATDSTGTYVGAFSGARAGLYSVSRIIDSALTVVNYVVV